MKIVAILILIVIIGYDGDMKMNFLCENKPLALDLCCKGGGASKGLNDAGFKVIGVDKDFSKNYPYEKIVGDVFSVINYIDLSKFALVWISPPCQRYSVATPADKKADHPEIKPFIKLMNDIKVKYPHLLTIIENVPLAPIRNDLVLDGGMFNLKTHRKRIFELSFACPPPTARSKIFGPTTDSDAVSIFGLPTKAELPKWRQAMNIDWMNGDELREAIPPAYAEWLGKHALSIIKGDNDISVSKEAINDVFSRYIGKKTPHSGLCQKIINIMPKHDIYIEAFAGTAQCYKHKSLADCNYLIEKDPQQAILLKTEYGNNANIIENDAIIAIPKLINRYKNKRLMIYLDPPYVKDSRSHKKAYRYELNNNEHVKLCIMLNSYKDKANFILSGYHNDIYKKHLTSWQYREIPIKKHGYDCVEVLWYSFLDNNLPLHDTRYIGNDALNRQRINRIVTRYKNKFNKFDKYFQQCMINFLHENENWGEYCKLGGNATKRQQKYRIMQRWQKTINKKPLAEKQKILNELKV